MTPHGQRPSSVGRRPHHRDAGEPNRRRFLGGALAAGAGAFVLGEAGTARAASAAPDIAGCDTWGARPPAEPIDVLDRPARKIIVHHTATANSTDHSRSHAFALARSIQDHHLDHNGWSDSGQQFTISRGGHVTEGRHHSLAALRDGSRHVDGAHCLGQNRLAVGIENEGTYHSADMRGEHYAVLVDLCVRLCRQYDLDAYLIHGHRDFNATGCPGDRLHALLPQLRRDVADRIGGDPTGVSWPLLRRGDQGERVHTLQYLLTEHGAGIGVDGAFGPATEDAVSAFQRSTGALVDGIAGDQTWNQAVRRRERGDTGPAVKAIQHRLSTGVDGVFGPNTESAVATFQSRRGIRSDGVVEARTWSALVG